LEAAARHSANQGFATFEATVKRGAAHTVQAAGLGRLAVLGPPPADRAVGPSVLGLNVPL
ncbi:MAG: hypothetical protein ACR2RL_19235, partial [Gammaproteobacteria bacterium]